MMLALPALGEHGNETRALLSPRTEPVDESSIVLEPESVEAVRLPPAPPRSIRPLEAEEANQGPVSATTIVAGSSSVTVDPDSAALRCSSIVESGQRGDAEGWPGGSLGGEVPQMREPHISTLYEKQDVMAKHFGVTPQQALRTQGIDMSLLVKCWLYVCIESECEIPPLVLLALLVDNVS